MYNDPLHVAYIRTNQWMHAIELQTNRILGPVSNPESDGMVKYRNIWNQKQRDIDYFLIALNRLRKGVISANKRLDNPEIKRAVSAFDRAIPDVKNLRDIAEHFDDYDWGKGKLEKQKKLTNESPSWGWGPDDAHIRYRGKNLSIIEARTAARRLHNVVMDELAKAGRQINLSEWPLVQYKNKNI